MPEIQTADVGRKLQERYDLIGPPPAPFLAPDVSPVVIVDDLTGIDVLERAFERAYLVNDARTGSVGNRAQLRLINPTGSGVQIVLKRVGFDVAVTSQVRLSEPIALVGALTIAGFATDGRVVGRAAGGVGNGITAGTGSGQTFLQVAAGALFAPDFLALNYVLTPGQMVECTQQITNDTVTATFIWTERSLA